MSLARLVVMVAITRNQSPQDLSVCLIKMYGPSWDMAVVATAALTRKRGRVLCIENPLPVVPLQPLVGQSSIFRTRPLCTMV